MADDPTLKAGLGSFDPNKTRLFCSPEPEVQSLAKARKRPPPLPAAARPDWHNKTRVLPIERLLPGLAQQLPEVSGRLRSPRKLDKPMRALVLVSKQRVYAWAVCIVLWVSVAAASGAPTPVAQSVQAGAAAEPRAVTIQTSIPAAERAPVRAEAAKPAAAPSPLADGKTQPLTAASRVATPALAPERPAPAPVLPRVSPRAAVEALAAGDPLAASHLYAVLAQQNPDNLAYARAARILKERVQAQHDEPGATP